MMVVGGYTLDLTCDCLECQAYNGDPDYRTEEKGFKRLAGNNFTECYRAAKKRGWKFYPDNTLCLAPGHSYSKEEDED
ncbi:hypothetical protein V7J91_21195 [Klebsiella pneumoniae]|uniref:hypothetical protein n=1 Tax=Klebsiella pneumoniae TaxID=573 RepID=UPI002FF08A2C